MAETRVVADLAPAEELSPELVLVSPDLAEQARAALPDRDPDGWMPAPRAIPAPEAVPPPPDPDQRAVVPRGRLGRASTVAAVAGTMLRWTLVGVGAATIATGALTTLGQSAGPVLSDPQSSSPSPTGCEEVSPKAPTLAWDPMPRAAYYRVDIVRRGVVVLRLYRTRPETRLPRRWSYHGGQYELEPGRYGLVVRSGRGPVGEGRVGAPIVRSAFDVVARPVQPGC